MYILQHFSYLGLFSLRLQRCGLQYMQCWEQTQSCMYRQAKSWEYSVLPTLLHDGALSGFDLCPISHSKTSSLGKEKAMDATAVHTAKMSSQDFSVYLFISVHNERESQRCETPPSGLSSQRASPPVAPSYAIAALLCSICMIIVIRIKHGAIIRKREDSK